MKELLLPGITSVRCEEVEACSLLEKFRQMGCPVNSALLYSGGSGPNSTYSVLGHDPFFILRTKAGAGTLETSHGTQQLKGNPFDMLKRVMENYSPQVNTSRSAPPPRLFVCLSYDLKDSVEALSGTALDDLRLPEMAVFFFRCMWIRDEARARTWKLETACGTEALPSLFRNPPGPTPARAPCGQFHPGSNFQPLQYQEAVKKVKEYIKAGDIYQANLSQRFRVPFGGDSFSIFEGITRINPAPMSAYFDCGDFKIISSSPERFLMRKGNYIQSRPIKGTRPRGKTPKEDEDLRKELTESGKDWAELAMIIDLMRNDLGRTAIPGTVKVEVPKAVEAYANVFHLVSTVSCKVPGRTSSADIVKSCFPGGSITGCPKIRAMEVIEELEGVKRSFYTGSLGYMAFDGDFDLNIAIRTFIEKDGFLYFGLGGGIVYDSDPEAEYNETLHKGASMVQTLREIQAGTCTVPGTGPRSPLSRGQASRE